MNSMQMVVFSIETQEYGIDISCAQEIIRIPKQITKIPSVPEYVEGMFNLRGKAIPIIDLKKRFKFEGISGRGEDSRLLVLNLQEVLLGVIVDDVSEVISVEETQKEKLSSVIAGISDKSIEGICKIDTRIILILDPMKMLDEIFNDNRVKELAI